MTDCQVTVGYTDGTRKMMPVRLDQSMLVAVAIGLLGAFLGGRGFANGLQNTVSSLWAVPRAERPGFPANYLRTIALLLLLTVGVAVTAAASAAAGVVTA